MTNGSTFREEASEGLNINTYKKKVLSFTSHPTLPICDNEQNIEGVNQFLYI